MDPRSLPPPHYISVFKLDSIRFSTGVLVDIGDDPCFDDPPSWGICRPNIRRALKIGSVVVFVGHSSDYGYILKGWYQVGSKISVVEALGRFPQRRNVIIDWPSSPGNKSVKWKSSQRRRLLSPQRAVEPPIWLRRVGFEEGYVQRASDEHEI